MMSHIRTSWTRTSLERAMSVASWRLRSASKSVGDGTLDVLLSAMIYSNLIIICVGLLVAGCIRQKSMQIVYDTKLTDTQVDRAHRECDYEAQKATAASSPGAAFYGLRSLYLACMDLKGAKFLREEEVE